METKFKLSKSDIIVLIIAVMMVLCSIFVVKPVVVRESSMEPTLYDGNFLLLNRLAEPEKGDIIVFKSDVDGGKLLIKRAIGTEGDTVKVENRSVYLNDALLDEPYVKSKNYRYEEDKTWEVPEDKIFAMGDNREVSLDSRYDSVGFVDDSKVVGVVMTRLFPFNKIGNPDK